MSAENSDYLLGTSDEEIERLEFQHSVWKEEIEPLWDQADIKAGDDVLDLGCGPGFASQDLANIVGAHGMVRAFDTSEKYIRFLEDTCSSTNIANIRAQVCDVHEVPLQDESVDHVFVRWVLCFVSEPEKVIAEAIRVLRPGGSLLIVDYFNYRATNIFPLRQSFTDLFAAYYKSLKDCGGTYDIGDRLPQMIVAHKASIISMTPINRIASPGSRTWEWLVRFTRSFLPKLIDGEYMKHSEAKQLQQDFEEASNDPTTFFYTPPILGIIAKK